MGVAFEGHPRLKRIFLWDGFPGHPLRKDFLSLPGGFRPGLARFPYEFPEGEPPGYSQVAGQPPAQDVANAEEVTTPPEGEA